MTSPFTGSSEEQGDVLTNVLMPMAIIGMVGSLVYFMIDLRSVIVAGGEDMLKFVCFWFLIGTVGIEIIRATRGSESIATPYGMGLGAAMLLFVYAFTVHFGGMAATADAGLSLLTNYFIVGVLWWVSSWLSRECMRTEASLGDAGLLSRPKDTASVSRRRHVGKSVIYFALTSLAIFGLGQRLLMAAKPDIYQHAFWCMVVNLFCALSLLAVTNLSSLRIYVRHRRLELPNNIRAMWVSTSAVTVIVILIFAWALPRREPHVQVAWEPIDATRTFQGPPWAPENIPFEGGRKTRHPSLYRMQRQGHSSQTPAEGQTRPGSNVPGPQTAGSTSRSPAQGPAASGQDGESPQTGRGPGLWEGQNPPSAPPTSAGRMETPLPAGQQKERQPSSSSEPAPPDQRPSLDAQQMQARPDRNDSAAHPRSATPERIAAEDLDRVQPERSPQEAASQIPEQPLQALSGLTPLLRWLAIALMALVILYATFRWLPHLWARLQTLMGWRPSGFLQALAARIADWWQRLTAHIDKLRLRPHPAQIPESPLDLRYDPFADPDRNPREIIADVYATLMAYAAMLGYPRSEHQTPYEYLRKLPAALLPLRDQAILLTRLYVQAAYTSQEIPAEAVAALEEAWHGMKEHIARQLEGERASIPAGTGQGNQA